MTREEKTAVRRREREEILKKISSLEAAAGNNFYIDVEPDPPGHELAPHEVDYLRRKPISKIKTALCRMAVVPVQAIVKRRQRITLVGEENLKGIRGAAIITSNHFSIFENLAVKTVADRMEGHGRFYRVIKGTNYFLPGVIGFLMKNCDTLPLSKNLKTMRLFRDALSEILKKGGRVFIYPEQAMWWNYRKPRPPQAGAFFYAARNMVPVIPCFVTMEDQPGKFDSAGYPLQAYTVHIMPPIYPDPEKTFRENEREMQEKNYTLCLEKYKEIYGTEAKRYPIG